MSEYKIAYIDDYSTKTSIVEINGYDKEEHPILYVLEYSKNNYITDLELGIKPKGKIHYILVTDDNASVSYDFDSGAYYCNDKIPQEVLQYFINRYGKKQSYWSNWLPGLY